MVRPHGDRKTTRFTVSRDAQDYEVLREIAQDQDVSVAWAVRRSISELVRYHQAGSKAPELTLAGSVAPDLKVGSR